MTDSDINAFFRCALANPMAFARLNSRLIFRPYQVEAARAIAHSILHQRGLSLVVMFPRQSGKNELQANLESWLLTLYSHLDLDIVKISPTWKPQSLNAMYRLERLLKNGAITRTLWKKESGYIYRIGRSRISFYSGEPQAHIVGATASLLLEIDEAQDVGIAKYDKEIAPMAASTNATRVFWGTAWTSQTLLARELRAARKLEELDGIRRVFRINGEDVARVVPAYDAFLRGQVQRMGRMHPMVRTQFFSEEIDGETGMFSVERQAFMRGSHLRQSEPSPGRVYVFLLDVGGEEASVPAEQSISRSREHDATALTIVEVDLSTLHDTRLKAPTYKVVNRLLWRGSGQPALYDQILALAGQWKPRHIIIDATGIGAGLAGFLSKSFPARTKPFIFTAASKSRLGWDFLAVIDTGRFQDHLPDPADGAQAVFWREVQHCQMQVQAGPAKIMRWGVPENCADPASGEKIHDDLLISAAMCALLDSFRWGGQISGAGFFQIQDPLENIGKLF